MPASRASIPGAMLTRAANGLRARNGIPGSCEHAFAQPRLHPRAFTLLELVLVMVVITAALSLAAPALRGFARGAKMRDASTQFVAMCQWARTQAISNARVYRLQVDLNSPQYQVLAQQGDQFVAPATDFGQVFVMPEGYRISLTRADGVAGNFIDFYPTGRTDPARIQINADDGEATLIECPTPAETFKVVATGEAAR